MVVALWTTAMFHCQLEELPGFQFLACSDGADSAPHQDADCKTDSCASVEGALYKTNNSKITVLPPAAVVVLEVFRIPAVDPDAGWIRDQQFSVGSPELPVTWQFSLRTALPPRAPSLVS